MLLGELVFRLGSRSARDHDFDDGSFALCKTKVLLDQYTRFFGSKADFRPRRILELGIWDSGSLAFWNEIFRPEKLVGVDRSDNEDSRALRNYVASRGLVENLKTFWQTEQQDATRLAAIVDSELDGTLDLVIDDASHQYEATKRSFEILFPRLRPGGLYIIEDWAWGYWREYQSEAHPWFGQEHPGRLVKKFIEAAASAHLGRAWIANVSVFQGFTVVERAEAAWSSNQRFQLEGLIERSGEPATARSVLQPPVEATTAAGDDPRLIAFYLPQFHPIPENDAWWGKGFTEWTNVARARPMFAGHDQPHLPAELGFYDLRLSEVREAQADLAGEYGLHGFCYFHYWFEGRTLLERPFREVLATSKPNFPFCLCWANENWTRAWDGLEKDVLIEQRHSEADDRRHRRHLADAFQHPSYIRVGDKPLFLIYRISKLPNPGRTAEIFREEARKFGIEDLYLLTVESLRDDRVEPESIGFDAAVEFQPDWLELGAPSRRIDGNSVVFDYPAVVERMLSKETPSYTRFPGVTPGWDNSARRRQNAVVLAGSTPELYERWLGGAIDQARRTGAGMVFINAWNEWGGRGPSRAVSVYR